MTARTYPQIKEHYENTKPIRGRSGDARPAGKRRRDWELVVKTEQGYAYQLHGTRCVEFTPDKLILRTGGWTTVGTGKFIHSFSPAFCIKRNNAIWVGLLRSGTTPTHTHQTGDWLWVPIPKDGTVTFTWDEAQERYVLDPTRIHVRKVNRKRANEARKRVKPLLDYIKAMLKLSDGHVQRDDIFRAGVTRLVDLPDDEAMTTAFYYVLRVAKAVTEDWRRGIYKYRISDVQRTLYKLHDADSPEIYDYEWVDPSSQMPTNHVGYT